MRRVEIKAPAGFVKCGQTSTRLHRGRRDALAVEAQAHGVLRVGKRCCGCGLVAVIVIEHEIARHARVH